MEAYSCSLIIFFLSILLSINIALLKASHAHADINTLELIPTPNGHWSLLNINCDGDIFHSEPTDFIRQKDGFLDQLLPKRKKKRKKQKHQHKRTVSKKSFQNDFEVGGEKANVEGSIFTSKLFGENSREFDDEEDTTNMPIFQKMPVDYVGSGNKDYTNMNKGLKKQELFLREGKIGGSKQIHINLLCSVVNILKYAVNETVTFLIINSDDRLVIYDEPLQSASNLLYIKLRSVKELTIPPTCSWLPTSVETLDFSHSRLGHLSLADCEAELKSLSVAGASLENLQICLPSLESLDASWNRLENLTHTCSKATDSVVELDISQNKLNSWSTCGWPNVTHAKLIYNEITTLDLLGCESHALIDLNVAHNELHKTPSNLPPGLLNLDLSHNRIKILLPVEGVIQTLVLSHNDLTSLGERKFRFARQLLTLDLSYNGLTSLNGHCFTGLRELRFLDISRNNIHDIAHESFRPLRRLQHLRINGNKLTQLDHRLIANLPKNLQLELQGNPWRCSCHLLSSLSRAVTAHCNEAKCHKKKLQCQQGSFKIAIQDVLKKCLAAIEGISSDDELYSPMYRETEASDEDLSEEVSHDIPMVAIPGAALIIVVPLLILLTWKIYAKRKHLKKKYCSCLAPSQPEETTHSLSPWVPNGAQRHLTKDSDSESEL